MIDKKIYLVTATIRPEVCKKTEALWRERCSDNNNVRTVIAVDSEADKQKFGNGYECIVYGMKAGGITKPLTKLTQIVMDRMSNYDIMVVFSDDFEPPKNWDKYLFDFYSDNNEKALSVKIDGHNDGSRNVIVSLPILDGNTLKKLNGYVYHPAYNHQYSDNELFDNLNFLNCLHIENDKSAPSFKHNHWCSKDRVVDEHDKNTNSLSATDKKTYEFRKKQPFEKRVAIRPILSILICSLKERKEKLDNLLKILHSQTSGKNVEIKVCVDNREMNIPQKRNKLLNSAMGEYVCFIDDDDIVSNKYVEKILECLKYKPDCVGFMGMYFRDGVRGLDFSHSIIYKRWRDTRTLYERTPNHLNPIKKDLVFKIGGFNETIRYGEDRDFSKRITQYLIDEVMIDDIHIYKYMHDSKSKQY